MGEGVVEIEEDMVIYEDMDVGVRILDDGIDNYDNVVNGDGEFVIKVIGEERVVDMG